MPNIFCKVERALEFQSISCAMTSSLASFNANKVEYKQLLSIIQEAGPLLQTQQDEQLITNIFEAVMYFVTKRLNAKKMGKKKDEEDDGVKLDTLIHASMQNKIFDETQWKKIAKNAKKKFNYEID